MRRFTLFTLLYLATGICLTAIAFGHPDITPNAKTSLLVAAGLLYLCAVFTTFPFWHQFAQRFQAKLRDQPAWQQNFVALAKPIGTIIAPWLVIASVFVSTSSDVLNHNWAIEALASAAWGLPLIFLSVEDPFCPKPNPSISPRIELSNGLQIIAIAMTRSISKLD